MGEIKQSVVVVGVKKSQRVLALMDSGASTSYIDIKFATKLGIPIYNNYHIITLGNGDKIRGYESYFPIIVRGRKKPISAIVIPVPEKLVLGHDFMQDNDIILDFNKEKFKFSNKIPRINRRLRL